MDQYSNWRKRIAAEPIPIHDGEPDAGFYRFKKRGGGYDAAAYWYAEDGSLQCVMGGVVVNEQVARERWVWCAKNPITEDIFRSIERGGAWPDMDEAVQTQINNRGIGHNSGDVDAFAELSDQIFSAARGAKAYAKIESEEQAQRAQSLRSRLLELKGGADKARKKLADPLYQQWKDVNARWKPIIDEADDAGGIVTRGLNAYATAQLRSAQKKAEEAAAAAQATDAAQSAEPAPAAPTQIKGAYGRAASVKQTWELKEITDLDKVYQHFKGASAVRECLQKLAAKAIKDGGDVPGTIREEVARVK